MPKREDHGYDGGIVVGGDGRNLEQRRIPRIIHQTWFEELTEERYPALVRLQNSWRNAGWEYRFYTDTTARDYIIEHFPQRFIKVFDALIPGAYKVSERANERSEWIWMDEKGGLGSKSYGLHVYINPHELCSFLRGCRLISFGTYCCCERVEFTPTLMFF